MTARTSTSLKQAFKRFVELVKPIDDVHYVVGNEDDGCDIYTFITKLDEGVSDKVHEAEFEVMRAFPHLQVLFHVRYLDGRPLSGTYDPHHTFFKHAA